MNTKTNLVPDCIFAVTHTSYDNKYNPTDFSLYLCQTLAEAQAKAEQVARIFDNGIYERTITKNGFTFDAAYYKHSFKIIQYKKGKQL